jgi:epoxyqueuosine reductase
VEAARHYREYLAAGRNGSMAYLERHAASKLDPAAILPGCRAVIVVALSYYQNGQDGQNAPHVQNGEGHSERGVAAAASGRVSRYAWGRDYHKTLTKRLRALRTELEIVAPGETFQVGSDATPLLETHFATQAGLGFRGKHTLVINGELGSWFFIGELLSTVAVEPYGRPITKRCGAACTHCIDVCPTSAITGPYQLDARRCISYLTIEHRGPIDPELRPLMGDWLFGCDLCQEVCPWTVRARTTTEPDFLTQRAGPRPTLAEVLALRTHQDLVARFAGSPLLRAGRDRLVRNACTVAANVGARELLPMLRELQADSDPGVAEHARWAVGVLAGQD